MTENDELSLIPGDNIKCNDSDLDYPTMEEYEKLKTQSTSNIVPHPDEQKQIQGVFRRPVQTTNNLLNGIGFEDGTQPKNNRRIDPNNPQPFTFTKPEPKNPELELISTLINNCKKSEYDVTFNLKVKLPYINFFDVFDEEFVNKNEELIFNELIKMINHDGFKEQLKTEIKNIYKNVQ